MKFVNFNYKDGKGTRTMTEKKGKKRWWIIGIATVVIIALVIGVLGMEGTSKNEPKSEGSVEKIIKRTIANSISGNGVVEAANRQDVTGGAYGMKVKEVNVEVGAIVAEGDVICIFDTSDIDDQIKDLKKRISETEADRKEQNADYDQRMTDADEDRAEQLVKANENLAEAQQDLAEAEAELAAKKAEYDAYIADADPTHTATTLEAIQMESVIETKESNVEAVRMRVEIIRHRLMILQDRIMQI